MPEFEQMDTDKVLVQLERGNYLHPQLKFMEKDQKLIRIGKGGFSDVYEMYDEENPETHYAVKVIGFNRKIVTYTRLIETTRLQYQLAEQSDHIVRIFARMEIKVHLDQDGNLEKVTDPDTEDYQNDDGIRLQFIWMERLQDILKKDKFGKVLLNRPELKSETGILEFARQIGEAIMTAHQNNVLHRDIKLENIFWDTKSEQYKLGDFGLSKYVEDVKAETVLYTNGYGAPEIERRLTNNYNAAADIYSFGITLYLLFNELKFPASDGYYVNPVQYSEEFVFPAPIHASQSIARVLRKMCSYRVEDRYRSIEEALIELERTKREYSETDFAEEYEDLATATYREKSKNAGEKENDSSSNTDMPAVEKKQDIREDTRQWRKQRAQEEESEYAWSNALCFLGCTLCFFALFKTLGPKENYAVLWQWWLLIAAVLVEAAFQQIRELHIVFAAVPIGLTGYMMYTWGIWSAPIAMIITAVAGMPVITAGCAAGSILWTMQMLTGRFSWVDIFSKWKLEWLIIGILVSITCKNIFLNSRYGRISPLRFNLLIHTIDRTGLYLPVIGLAVRGMNFIGMITVSDELRRLHPVLTGIGILLAEYPYIRSLETKENDEEVNE